MRPTQFIRQSARKLDPGAFALVMATGIVSIDAIQHGMPLLSRVLFALSLAAFAWLLLLTGVRLRRARQEMLDDFTHPARGGG